MAEGPKGYGEQLFQRLQGKGLSRAKIYKALAMQRLSDEVMELGAEGKLPEAALIEISKIKSPARQKQLAEISVQFQLNNVWVKELGRLIRNAEKTANDKESNRYWDFFFEVKDSLEREGATKALLDRVKNFSVDAADLADPGDRQVVDFRKYETVLGRGLDVGTSNICAAVRAVDSKVVFNIQRNAFLDVRSDVFTKKMLMKLGVDHIVHGEKGYVIGDAAFELANIFEKNTRRPMKDGMISPVEHEALLIVSMIIGQLLGPPKEPGEICSFSIPADPIDADRNVIYHRGALEAILRKLGYEPKALLEGHCVVLGELAEDDYTGIGISCGAGMFNVSIAYKAMPALTFSTSRGGDWIDNNVATALGMTSSQVCAVKESGVDLSRPRDRVEEAICIYYRNLIQYSLETIRQKFESAHNMPSFRDPITVVCAGGTSMIKGFIDVFREEFRKINFPLDVKEIRMARDPLRTVAHGAMVDAVEETKARGRVDQGEGPVNVRRADVSKVTSMEIPAHLTPSAGPHTIGRSEPSKVEAGFKVPTNFGVPPKPKSEPVLPSARVEPPTPAPAPPKAPEPFVPRSEPAKVESWKPPAAPGGSPTVPRAEPARVEKFEVPAPKPPLPTAPKTDRWKMPPFPGGSAPSAPPIAEKPATAEPLQTVGPVIPSRVGSKSTLPPAPSKPPTPAKKPGDADFSEWKGMVEDLKAQKEFGAPAPPAPAEVKKKSPSDTDFSEWKGMVDDLRGPKEPVAPAPPNPPPAKKKSPSDTDYSEWKGMVQDLGATPPSPPAKDPKKKPKGEDPGDIPLFS